MRLCIYILQTATSVSLEILLGNICSTKRVHMVRTGCCKRKLLIFNSEFELNNFKFFFFLRKLWYTDTSPVSYFFVISNKLNKNIELKFNYFCVTCFFFIKYLLPFLFFSQKQTNIFFSYLLHVCNLKLDILSTYEIWKMINDRKIWLKS